MSEKLNMKTPITYYGGKQQMASIIVPMLATSSRAVILPTHYSIVIRLITMPTWGITTATVLQILQSC